MRTRKRILYERQYRQQNKERLYTYRKAYELEHKEHISAYRKVYKKKYAIEHPIKLARSNRDRELRRNFGITRQQYLEILVKQSNHCAICPITPKQNGKDLAVDHCHRTNRNRGLLCSQCNVGLGYFKDSPERLYSAINYLSVFQ
jgi:hypothetical protein